MQEVSEQHMQLDNGAIIQNMFVYPAVNDDAEIQSQSQHQVQMVPNGDNVDLPFVRIHAFDVPISNKINAGMTYVLNNISSNREVKPKIEPIKSELNEVNVNESLQRERNSNMTTDSENNSRSKVLSSIQEFKILKCKHCMFLSISRFNLENHLSTIHENSNTNKSGSILRPKLHCPGCDNHFYSAISFYSHLEHDHFMIESEITKFFEYQEKQNDSSSKHNRIYLKTMDCIRNHTDLSTTIPYHRTPPESLNCNEYEIDNEFNFIDLINEDNLFSNINDELMTERLQPYLSSNISKPKQKITIKSVENLQEPLYSQKVQNLKNNEKLANSSFNLTGKAKYDNTDYCDGFHNSGNLTNSNLEVEMEYKKTRRAASKIYIKNVDILKEPIFLPPTNISNILNVNETLYFDNFPSKEMTMSTTTVPYMLPSLDINDNFTDIAEALQIRQFVNDQFSFDYNSNNDSHKINLIKNKIKVNIKNVDILKQPQSQTSTSPTKRITNFIHLRTVDELNLMNKNQINLMNNLQSIPDNSENLEAAYTSLENSKKNEEHCIYTNYLISPDTESANTAGELIQNNCNNGDINLETADSSSLQNCQFHYPHDLITPYFLMDEISASENDREILLDCAEELILNQEKATDNVINESSQNICNQNFNIIQEEIGNKIVTEWTLNECVDEVKKHANNDKVLEIPGNSTCEENILNASINNCDIGEISVSEKGRIYVSDNLMEDRIVGNELCSSEIEPAVLNSVKQRTKGRPIGAKTSRSIKFNKLDQNNSYDTNFKCDLIDCAVRFKRLATLEYHKKCHKRDLSHLNIQCPECFSEEFSNWNTLHTHLWRHHNIDMELYNCELCSFKTPILSRLYNTHLKIHSNERNFKCEQCEKAFKNSKQLKNHRRLHRSVIKPLELHKCELCSSAFSNTKTKKEHLCRQIQIQAVISLKCSICKKLCSSKSALKLHISTHKESGKFKCNNCNYFSNDHNAFRRHKSTHDKSMMYDCPYCGYKCIQSILYKKHLTTKHPELASNIIHKCNICQFTTINQTQLHVHSAKHENKNVSPLTVSCNNIGSYLMEDDLELESINLEEFSNKTSMLPIESLQKNKIKVKSDLVLTDPTKFLLQTTYECDP